MSKRKEGDVSRRRRFHPDKRTYYAAYRALRFARRFGFLQMEPSTAAANTPPDTENQKGATR